MRKADGVSTLGRSERELAGNPFRFPSSQDSPRSIPTQLPSTVSREPGTVFRGRPPQRGGESISVIAGPRNQRPARGLLAHRQEAVALYATADLEGMLWARLAAADFFRQRFSGQGKDRQVPVQVLEDFQTGSWCVFSEQSVQVLEASTYRGGGSSRQIQGRLLFEAAQLDTESLEPRLDRLKLLSNREGLATGQEADKVPRFAFEPEDLRLHLARPIVVARTATSSWSFRHAPAR